MIAFDHISEKTWRTYDGDEVDLRAFVERYCRNRLVFVGTDSHNYRCGEYTKFSTTVTFYDIGRGGVCTLSTERCRYMPSLRERLMRETWVSVETALFLSSILDEPVDICIHVDVNADVRFKSGRYKDELMGMVVGQGFAVAVKPDAWASSKVADKFSR
jgi:predicted RNase H-related nuclease YkuK (DUF458 family)